MARTVLEIYNSLIAKKQDFSELNGLTPSYAVGDNPYQSMLDELSSASAVSLWRLWLFLVACAHHTMEVLFDSFKADAEEIANRSLIGSLPWYEEKMKKWQYGFSPIWDSQNYTWNYSDTTSTGAIAARIIKHVSATEERNNLFNEVLLKLAKESSPGVLVPLDSAELTSADIYLDRIKPPGVKTVTISLPADSFRGSFKVYFDGTLDPTVFTPVFEQELSNYLKAIDFNGTFFMDDFLVFLKSIPGVKHIEIISVEVKADADTVFSPVMDRYTPAAGYFNLIPVGTTPTETQIQYIPS